LKAGNILTPLANFNFTRRRIQPAIEPQLRRAGRKSRKSLPGGQITRYHHQAIAMARGPTISHIATRANIE
jgi:hypothetical protein